MRRVALLLLWVFICSVPWGIDWTLFGTATITRMLGIAATGVGVLAVAFAGRIRKADVICWFAAAYAMASFLSLSWTISYAYTAERVGTHIQFVALIWLIRELAPSRAEQDSLRLAFCIGGLVFVFGLLSNFGAAIQFEAGRYTAATGINPNFVGFVLVTGLPMAWHLFLHHRGTVAIVSCVYCLVAPVTVVLTGSRTSFLALFVAASVIPFTLRPRSFSFWLRVAVLLFAAVVTIELLVPRQVWDRLMTIDEEVEGGTMSGRTPVWAGGVSLFLERPLLGVGAGAFQTASAPLFNAEKAPHNAVLALLVEQGIVGLLLFGSLVAACAWVIYRLPSPERQLWAALIAAWLVFGMSGDIHNDRVTWVMFGLLAARHGAREPNRLAPGPMRVSAAVPMASGAHHPRRLASA